MCPRRPTSNIAAHPVHAHVACAALRRAGSSKEVLGGKAVTFTCEAGYFMTGKNEIHCLSTSKFDFDAPTCNKCNVDNCKLCESASKCKICNPGCVHGDWRLSSAAVRPQPCARARAATAAAAAACACMAQLR